MRRRRINLCPESAGWSVRASMVSKFAPYRRGSSLIYPRWPPALRSAKPTLGWYGVTLRRELSTALLLGAGCAAVVMLIVWLWWKVLLPSVVIGSSVLVSLIMAGLLGLSVPTILHALRWDPKIAAGPVTLAATDVMTLLFYFSIARLLLDRA